MGRVRDVGWAERSESHQNSTKPMLVGLAPLGPPYNELYLSRMDKVGSRGDHVTDSDVYENPEIEAAWIQEQRENVVRYLREQSVESVTVPYAPQWHVAPYVSLWLASCKAQQGNGTWVISGDLPTDYLTDEAVQVPREALRAFGKRWERAAASIQNGTPDPEITIGDASCRESQQELGDLLGRRAKLLVKFANDDRIWHGPDTA